MLSFKLPTEFVNQYIDRQPPWGFGINGNNAIGEITFIRTYSRVKPDGSKERWWEVCERVINGIYSIQKDHAKSNKLPWNDRKAQASAQEAFDRMFSLKWTPGGRGIWVTGSDLVHERGMAAALYNCAFVSTGTMTKRDPGAVFSWLMDALMLGVGVGYDSEGALKEFTIHQPLPDTLLYKIPDTREGWAESVRKLINAYLVKDFKQVEFDYSEIRPAGMPIRTFGGVASGHEPLEQLHGRLRKLFENRVGDPLDSVMINDIGNMIGACVISGNVRRSAEIYLGRVDDQQFYDLKNPAVFKDRNSYDVNDPGWSWVSNNTVVVRDGDTPDYHDIANRIVNNGEPGLLWLDTQRKYGRMVDQPNNKDWRASGTNPSLVAGTKVWTDGGIKSIEQLEDTHFKVRNLNGNVSDAYCWKSGENKKVYAVQLQGGAVYEATEEHKWPVWNGTVYERRGTLELKKGDKIANIVPLSVFKDGVIGSRSDGFLIGWNLGDGWIVDRGDHRQFGFIVAGKSDRESMIQNIITDKLNELGSTTKVLLEKDEINVRHPGVAKLFDEMLVGHKSTGLPASVWDSSVSDEFRIGLLDGLISSDGAVSVGDRRITFTTVHLKLAQDVCSLLGLFGVKSTMQLQTDIGFGKPYTRYDVRISGSHNMSNFSSLVQLSNVGKQQRLEQIVSAGHTFSDSTNFIKVNDVTFSRHADVWDVRVNDDTHAFQLDRCVTGNCSEITLESSETCNLVEVFLNHAESKEDFLRTLKFAFLYAKSVTLLPTHWPETNAVIQRNRRIGTSMTGIANFSDQQGISTLIDWANDGYATIQHWDKTYSEWLGIRESIKLTTVKPAGTTSLLAGASPGVHWSPGSQYYLRAIRFADNDNMLPVLRDAGYRIEADLVSANTQVVYFPVHTDALRSEKDVSLFEKAHLAAVMQRYWSDNAVSVTLSFDKQAESKYIANILHMFESQIKTASFLPMGNDVYPQQPYTSITKQEYEDYARQLKIIDWSGIYAGYDDAAGDKYCSNDSCLL